KICNEDLQIELEYFSEDYDEEREMEPRPEPNRKVTLTLWLRSHVVCRIRSLVKHISTDLPSTYKGLMEKPTPGSKQEKWQPMKLLMTEGKILKDQENPLGIIAEDRKAGIGSPLTRTTFPSCERNQERKSKGLQKPSNRREKDKSTTPSEAPILMIRHDELYTENKFEGLTFEGKEITFPSRGSNSSAPVVIKAKIFGREVNQVHMDSGSSCEAIYKHCFMKLKPSIKASKVDSKVPLIGEDIKIVVSTIHGANKFYATGGIGTVLSTHESDKVKEGMKKPCQANQAQKKGSRPRSQYNRLLKVEELMKAGILRKVKHQTWVANPVMGFDLKCFLEAYKGYHQIQMAEGDKDKTAFFAGERIFCYQKMPFGLKNAGATYQRLVDKVFHDQIGRNLEAYVKDMVSKSTSEEEMLADIKETFEKFRSINMKLNPKKCSFGVEEGPLLGHLITKQGIRANPSKRAELNYPGMEKLILAFVHVSRRLRRYFQEADEKADIKPTKTMLSCEGKLFTDGAVSSDGSSAGLMLIDPEGKEYTYTLRFEFKTTNNEAEYEALLSLQRIKSHTILLSYYGAYGNNEPYRKAIGSKSTRMVDDLAQAMWVHRMLPRNNQKEILFSLTYCPKAIIPISKNDVAKYDRGRIKEVNKRRGSREIASIREAYYRRKLRRHHNKKSSHSIYKIGDFILLSQNNTRITQVWQGPHMISEVYGGGHYKIVDASDHSLTQTTGERAFISFTCKTYLLQSSLL
nr:reverse transcriptase domain-containing protein [Tanacetum cinerariifolium]